MLCVPLGSMPLEECAPDDDDELLLLVVAGPGSPFRGTSRCCPEAAGDAGLALFCRAVVEWTGLTSLFPSVSATFLRAAIGEGSFRDEPSGSGPWPADAGKCAMPAG